MQAGVGSCDLTEFVSNVPVPGVPPMEEEGPEGPPGADLPTRRVVPAIHHRLLIEALESVERGERRRVMILLPPGTAKSTYCSVAFPPWFLGRKSGRSIICTSYGSNLPRRFGRRCRNLIRTDDYLRMMGGVKLAGDSTAADQWELSNGSSYYAAGILAGITGHRTDGLVVDDPIKGREQADSETIRDKTWEAYLSDLRTRVKPGGWIVWVQTRWHEDDPAGRILPADYDGRTGVVTARDGEEWYVLCCQAECVRTDDPLGRKIGEYIWPEWFEKGQLAQEKLSQGPRNWSALYQQVPMPDTGDFYQRAWFQPYAKPPKHLRVYGCSDFAVSDGSGDWTVHLVWGYAPDGHLYLLAIWRDQKTSVEWVDSYLDLCAKWKPQDWAFEKGQIQKSVGPWLEKRKAEIRFRSGPYEHLYASTSDKRTRAQSFRGMAAAGFVHVPQADTEWNGIRIDASQVALFVDELVKFDGGVFDDQVDACSELGAMLEELYPPHVESEEKKRPDDFDDRSIEELLEVDEDGPRGDLMDGGLDADDWLTAGYQ